MNLYLSPDEFGKESVVIHQFVVGAFLDDPAAVENQNPVAAAYGTEPVRDHDTGTAHRVERFGHLPLGLVVKGAGRFVEQQQIRLGRNSAS